MKACEKLQRINETRKRLAEVDSRKRVMLAEYLQSEIQRLDAVIEAETNEEMHEILVERRKQVHEEEALVARRAAEIKQEEERKLETKENAEKLKPKFKEWLDKELEGEHGEPGAYRFTLQLPKELWTGDSCLYVRRCAIQLCLDELNKESTNRYLLYDVDRTSFTLCIQ